MKPTMIACAAALFCLGTTLSAEDAGEDQDYGEFFYQQRCSTCHGMSGKGDGPMTEILSVTVPDLTGLSAANDGEFPMLEVIRIIDGRSGLRGHDVPMPVYGALSRGELHPAYGQFGLAEGLIRGRTLAIAEYVESLQE